MGNAAMNNFPEVNLLNNNVPVCSRTLPNFVELSKCTPVKIKEDTY